ncbi:hypothetical protein [Nannocystis punicea]|uniref:DUF3806 domain-containing protein n=1 Tax=Nannocystis punicea TaxID=2995304 RepID=A0ABY7HHA6_9BACT|nr:hypothetical protein [Nannocystis poenicansa]WAS98663.1 hypothetical protein O0S08_21215 [Nannocystis poenicansa]
MHEALLLHSREAFQVWLAGDVEVRDELYALIGEPLGTDLESLDTLESFLLARYRRPNQILKIGEREILDAAARHIGLVMLLNLDDAAWAIELDDEDNVYYRLPIIRLADGAEECPLTMVTAALDRRKRSYLRGVVESYA